jgi:hypothetical protein
MCLIIDANVAHEFNAPMTDDAKPIQRWIDKRKGQIAIGGQLTKELTKTKLRSLLLELYRANIAVVYNKEKLEAEEKAVSRLGLCESNDVHVLALARVSGARVVFSKDGPLATDFTNVRIVTPRGRVYKRAAHAHLLASCRKCAQT